MANTSTACDLYLLHGIPATLPPAQHTCLLLRTFASKGSSFPCPMCELDVKGADKAGNAVTEGFAPSSSLSCWHDTVIQKRRTSSCPNSGHMQHTCGTKVFAQFYEGGMHQFSYCFLPLGLNGCEASYGAANPSSNRREGWSPPPSNADSAAMCVPSRETL